MLSFPLFFVALSLAVSSLASPLITPKPIITPAPSLNIIPKASIPDNDPQGTADGGALHHTVPGAGDSCLINSKPPALLTVSIVNSHTVAVSTGIASADSKIPIASGSTEDGTLAADATAAFAVPTNWAGRVHVNEAQYPPSTSDSLIETNFVVDPACAFAVATIDVSYVYVLTYLLFP